MKVLKSQAMKRLLAEGIRKTRGKKAPSDGYMSSLVYRTAKNGWHYQVEWIHDTRIHQKPYVQVYAFKPPRTYFARQATHTLYEGA